jgi:hypothetical protein
MEGRGVMKSKKTKFQIAMIQFLQSKLIDEAKDEAWTKIGGDDEDWHLLLEAQSDINFYLLDYLEELTPKKRGPK